MDHFQVLSNLLGYRERSEKKLPLSGERLLAWAVVAQWMRDVLTVLSGGTVYDEATIKRRRPGRPRRRVLTLEDLRAWLETEICAFWVEDILGAERDTLRFWFDDIVETFARGERPKARSHHISWSPERREVDQLAA